MTRTISPPLLEEFGRIRDVCKRDLHDIEYCAGYYDTRYLDFLSYYQIFPKDHFANVLEIGSGLGYHSAFLARISDTVTATDTDQDLDTKQTVYNFDNMRTLFGRLDIRNVNTTPASVDALPFPDDSFDMVYSSYVVNCCRNPELAIREMARVLKPGGVLFCVLPTRPMAAFRLLEFYVYLAKRSLYHLASMPFKRWSKASARGEAAASTDRETPEKSHAKLDALSHFPFPKPWILPSWVDEFRQWHFKAWRRLIDAQWSGDAFRVSQRTTDLLPFGYLAWMFFPAHGFKVHAWTRTLELDLGARRSLLGLGMNTVFIAEKSARIVGAPGVDNPDGIK